MTAVLAMRTLSSPWDTTFSELVEIATSDLLLLSPYISRRPLDALLTIISQRNRLATIHLHVVTDLSAASLAAETIDVAGLQRVRKEMPNACLTHLPKLHAKVYIADGRLAVVTSGNLTEGGLSRNYEFGLRIHDSALVTEIKDEAQAYARLGGDVSREALADIKTTAETLVALRKRAELDVNQALKQALKAQSRLAELKLLHVRAQGKTTHGILADTLLYLLRSGPRTTVDLHRMIQRIHPDICDDSVDRVIDGVHFGKKWKHYVRTAQQHLKKKALVAHEHGRWYRTSGGGRWPTPSSRFSGCRSGSRRSDGCTSSSTTTILQDTTTTFSEWSGPPMRFMPATAASCWRSRGGPPEDTWSWPIARCRQLTAS